MRGKTVSIQKLNDKIQSLTNNIAKTVGYLEELGQEKVQTSNKLEVAETLYAQKQKEKEDLDKRLNSLKSKELEDRGIVNSIKDKINFIQTLIDNLEGISKGAKTLVETSDWAKGNKTLLAHTGSSDDEYRLSIEAALRNNLNNIMVETIDDLKSGIQYLKEKEAGRAAFFAPALLSKKNAGFLDKIKEVGFKTKSFQTSEERRDSMDGLKI